jgi:hypothetical protein
VNDLFSEGMLKHMKMIEEVRHLVKALEKRVEDGEDDKEA